VSPAVRRHATPIRTGESMSLPPVLQNRLRLPVMAAPMFIVSNPELVIAQSCAGIVGSFPSLNARPQSALRDWLSHITEALDAYDQEHPAAPAAPFAVNLIVNNDANERLDVDLDTIVEFEVPIVITSLGARSEVFNAVHSYGGIVFHDVITNAFAQKAIAKGADGVIAVAAGAGGHGGTHSPFALIQEIREWFDGPLLLAGAIAHGRTILAAQVAGADLGYLGSVFIASEEANAPATYKQMIIDSTAADIVYTNRFTGIHGNFLRGSIDPAGADATDLAQSDPTRLAVLRGGDTPEATVWRDVWASGQGIGGVSAVRSAADVIAELHEQYEAARRELVPSSVGQLS
jgi:nitronate monooxygenase